jgi:hypothetical protein
MAINLFLAGMGSGKTYLDGLMSAFFIGNYPQVKGFIGANTYDQLNTSTLYRVKEVWDSQLGMKEGSHYVCGLKPPEKWIKTGHYFDSYSNIISFNNGAVIFQGSLENAKSHEGKEFGWAILDETKDTREEDVKEVILMRLREKGLTLNGKPWNPLYITTSPAKVPWINEWFKLDEREGEIKASIYSEIDFYRAQYDNKCVAISSTYHNQANLPPNYIEGKKFDLSTEQFNRMIYGDPFMKTGGEFYASFDRQVHVGKCEIIPDAAVHISFDQNVVPYITATIWQIKSEENIYQVREIDEFCLPNPNNKTEKLCEQIILKYHDLMLSNGLYYYGDASGKHRDTRGIENDYDIVERMFAPYISGTSNRVNHRNPGLNKRRMFFNRILEGKLPIRLKMDSGCKNTIADFEYIKETPEGTKLKQTVRDDKQGATYEKYGHCFTGDTIIDNGKRIKDAKVGDKMDFGTIEKVWNNGIKEVRTYQLGDVKIKCTPNHKILVLCDSIDYICIDKLANSNQTVLLKQENQWNEKRLFIKDLNSIAIQKLKEWQTGDITKDTLKSMVNGIRHIYTALFGSGIMVKYPQAFMFIILTAILTIMNCLTWGVLKASTISVTTLKTLQMKLRQFVWLHWIRQGLPLLHGINQTLVMSGIKNTGIIQSDLVDLNVRINQQFTDAKNAEKNTQQRLLNHNFALRNVKTDIVQGLQGSDTKHQKQPFVKFVVKNLTHCQRMLANFAVGNVIKTHAKVYDLTIKGEHKYSANGILVHNCSDSADYLICSAFDSYMD